MVPDERSQSAARAVFTDALRQRLITEPAVSPYGELREPTPLEDGSLAWYDNLIGKLNIKGHLGVADRVRECDAEGLQPQPTIGLIGGYVDAEVIAILAGIGEQKDVRVVMIDPHMPGATFVDRYGGLHTEYFYTIENGVIQAVQTSRPIPVDLPVGDFASDRLREVLRLRTPDISSTFFQQMGSDKFGAKRVLQSIRALVPEGMLIRADEVVGREKALMLFMEKHNPDEVFIKPNDGAQGYLARAFARTDITGMVDHIAAIQVGGHAAIIERRIESGTEDELAKDGEKVDYNIRSLVIVDGLQATFLDAEYRYQLRTSGPVNLSRGAQPRLITDPEEINAIAHYSEVTALNLVKFARATLGTMQHHRGLIGFDIIPAADGGYIIELNTRAVGGFATITRLQGEPMRVLSQRFVSALRESLDREFGQRRHIHDHKRELSNIETPDSKLHRSLLDFRGLFLRDDYEAVIKKAEVLLVRPFESDEKREILVSRLQAALHLRMPEDAILSFYDELTNYYSLSPETAAGLSEILESFGYHDLAENIKSSFSPPSNA